MEPLNYLHFQMRLEGLEVIDGAFIKQVEAVPGEDMPILLLAQLSDGMAIRYYDEALSPNLQMELAAQEVAFPDVDSLVSILRSHYIPFEVGHYKTYAFPSNPPRDIQVSNLSKQDPKVKVFGFDRFAKQVYVIEREDHVVSACVSARENEKCGEAWVYTDPAYRHQGFAQKVVNAWAGHLMAENKVPFYSHKIENNASASLARKLGLQSVFEEIVILPL